MSGEDFDVAIVGGGPAGAAAALACARGGVRVCLIEPMTIGGEAMNLPEVEEMPESALASGPDLVAILTERVLAAGVDLRLGDTSSALERDGDGWRTVVDSGAVTAAAVVLAPGAAPLGLPDAPQPIEDEVHEEGAFTCASCDAPLYSGRRVAVAGGGDTGAGAAVTLSGYASEVVLFEREDALSCQDALARRVADLANVEVRLGCEVRGTAGSGPVDGIKVATRAGEVLEQVDGVMLAVGMRPRSGLAAAHVDLDDSGAIRVGPDLETRAPGLFAAGDVREGSAWRCAAAWGDGLTAARAVLAGLRARAPAR